MADRIELEFRRVADTLLPPGTSVLAAVSGGADSMALLHLLVRMAAGRELRLSVGHLDHGLRRGSTADRKLVEREAARLGLRCVSDRRPVGALRRDGESPAEAARRVRLAFFREAAREAGARRIATGHHLDDQAETILMRLARGAGPKALTGMAVRGPGPFVRPLLHLERAALRRFVTRHRIRFREDPSNRDLRFDRNRLRELVVPRLAAALNPRAARNLVAAAERLRDDVECLDALAVAELERVVLDRRRGLTLDAAALVELPAAIGRRVVRLALQAAGVDPRRIGARHVAALLDLAAGGRGRRADLPGDLTAVRRDDTLRLSRKRT
jgi:tRNA(Ile)-lysidine synthetase-like protein